MIQFEHRCRLNCKLDRKLVLEYIIAVVIKRIPQCHFCCITVTYKSDYYRLLLKKTWMRFSELNIFMAI